MASTFDSLPPGTRLLDFDSTWPSGVRSDTDPAQTPLGYAWSAINMLNVGGMWACRPGYKCWATLPDGNLQGAAIFRPLVGTEICLAAVDGVIYRSTFPFTTFTPVPGLLFSPFAEQLFFEQTFQSAERITPNNLISAIKIIPSKAVMFIQDGGFSAPGWFDGANAGQLVGDPFETPSGSMMVWVGDRLWVASQEQLFASDIDNPFSFRENIYLGSASSFFFGHEITAMVRTPAIEAPQLMVFTAVNGSIVQANIRDRTLWPTTVNFQQEVIQVGNLSNRSTVSHFGHLVWFGPSGVAFFDPAQSGKITTRLPTRDNEMLVSKSTLDDDLSLVATGAFGQFLCISVPAEDRFNLHTWVLNHASFTSLSDDSGPAWAGYWLGTRPVQWMGGTVQDVERLFHVSVDDDGKNRLWEVFQPNRLDNGCPITWALFTRGMFGQTANVTPKPPGSKIRLKWVDVALSAVEEDLDIAVKYAGGMSGSFKSTLVKKLEVERGSLSNDTEIDINSPIFQFKPESRTIRTEDAAEQTAPESGACGVEKHQDDFIDTNFQLLVVGHGPVTIRWIRPVAIMEAPELTGSPFACQDETGLHAVRYDGAATKADTFAELVTALANAPEDLFTSVETVTLTEDGFVGTGIGTAESIVSQRAADRVAQIIATKFAEQELSALVPFIYSTGEGFGP